jgi:drug/metabolite transporter (DMT)-like permease
MNEARKMSSNSEVQKAPEGSKSAAFPIVGLILVQVLFGFNYAAMKVILEQFPPVLWGAIRMFLAAAIMFAFAFFILPKEQRKIDGDFLKKTFFFGLIGVAMNTAFFQLGLEYTTASNSAILNTLTPIFTLLFAILARQERFTIFRGAGFLVAVMGVLVLNNVESLDLSGPTMKGDIYTILNCITLALLFTLSRDFLKKHSPFWATAWMFLFGSLMLFAVSFQDFSKMIPSHVDGRLGLAVLYNVVGATILTFFLNLWSLTKVNPSLVGLFIYLQPVVAVFNSWYTFGEVPSARMTIAMTCIFIGVGLGVIKKA